MSIHCQNNTHVLQGNPFGSAPLLFFAPPRCCFSRRPAVVFRAAPLLFFAPPRCCFSRHGDAISCKSDKSTRSRSPASLGSSSSPRTILSFLSFTVYKFYLVQLIHNASRLVASLGTSIPYPPPRYSNTALMTSLLKFDLISSR